MSLEIEEEFDNPLKSSLKNDIPGRCLRYVAADEAEARKLVHKTLCRRATAKKRIGVSYRFRELVDPWEWVLLNR